MAIRMMTSKEEFEKDPTGIEVVRNYHGHEEGRIFHDYNCPERNRTSYTDRAELFTKYPHCLDGCKPGGPLYMKTSHVGMVLREYERNGRDDSDFYAVVWLPAEGRTEHIQYATTRGWTYPNSAVVDATPEVRAAYQVYREQKAERLRQAAQAEEDKHPRVGKKVKVVRGRKIPIGTVGEVVWFGENSYYRESRYSNGMFKALMGYEHYNPEKWRVGIRLLDGSRVFTAATNVEVVQKEAVAS